MKNYHLLGKFSPFIERDEHYFKQRGIFLDCRGYVEIAATAHFGYQVMILSATHGFVPEETLGRILRRRIVIEDHAWIASRALLYHCRIGHHAIVAAGSVVKNCYVPPHSMVEGNPAKIIKKYVVDHWVRIDPEDPRGY